MVSIFEVGPDTAAALLISAGSNPQRIHSAPVAHILGALDKHQLPLAQAGAEKVIKLLYITS